MNDYKQTNKHFKIELPLLIRTKMLELLRIIFYH